MDNEQAINAMRECVARAGGREAAAWSAVNNQDELALAGFALDDPAWLFGLADKKTGRTLVSTTAFLHKHDALRSVLAAGADPNQADGTGTLLTQAVRSGCVCCIETILDAGAKIDAEDALGMTPLIAAATLKVQKHALRCAQALLDKGADPNKVSAAGYFALAACAQENFPAQVNQMAGAHAQVDLDAGDGYTALFYAVDNQATEAAEALLRLGADYARKAMAQGLEGEPSSMTPLDLANALGDSATAGLLYSFAEASALRERLGLSRTPRDDDAPRRPASKPRL